MSFEERAYIHGGDTYGKNISYDFSVNVNPMGIPSGILKAVEASVSDIERYPDIRSTALKEALAGRFGLGTDNIAVGNGVSELITGIFNAVRPKRLILPAPEFYGYIRAGRNSDCELNMVNIIKNNGDALGLKEVIANIVNLLENEDAPAVNNAGESKTTVVMLTNPNNPIGLLADREDILKLADSCRDHNAVLGVDESFILFTGGQDKNSVCGMVNELPLVVFRSFTKIYSIPGVRLGAALAGANLIERLESCLPEWNISAAANAAGLAALKEEAFVRETPDYIERERDFLCSALKKCGIRTYPSEANYILIFTLLPLYEELLKRGFLIRDCANYEGLDKGFYRLAVRSRRENICLIEAIERVTGGA